MVGTSDTFAGPSEAQHSISVVGTLWHYLMLHLNLLISNNALILTYTQCSQKQLWLDDSEDENDFTKRIQEIKRFKQSIFPEVDRNIKLAQAHQKKNYDRRHVASPFSIGDLVLKKNMKNKHRMGGKLDEKWLGPYVVCGVTDYGNYKLQCLTSKNVLKQQIPVSQLKSYNQRVSLKVND